MCSITPLVKILIRFGTQIDRAILESGDYLADDLVKELKDWEKENKIANTGQDRTISALEIAPPLISRERPQYCGKRKRSSPNEQSLRFKILHMR